MSKPPEEAAVLKWQVTVPAGNTVTIVCTCDGKTLEVQITADEDPCSVHFEWSEWGCIPT